MKPTKELFGVDPRTFKGMLYEDVLAVKLEAAQHGYDEAARKYFSLPLDKTGLKEAIEANAEMEKHRKSIQTIELWINEMEEDEGE